MKKRKRSLKRRLESLVADMVEKGIRLDEAHHQLESQFLGEVLRRSEGNQSRAAETLKMHRNTLRRKLRYNGLL